MKVTSYFTKLAEGPGIGRDGLTMAERWERMNGEERKALRAQPPCPKGESNQSRTPFEDGLCPTHWDGPTRDPLTGEVS